MGPKKQRKATISRPLGGVSLVLCLLSMAGAFEVGEVSTFKFGVALRINDFSPSHGVWALLMKSGEH